MMEAAGISTVYGVLLSIFFLESVDMLEKQQLIRDSHRF